MLLTLIGVGFYYLRKDNTTPSIEIGEKKEDLGRDHVTDIYGVNYNSNPPISGPHFPVWAKKGLYDRLLSDGYLIHSLEHGYIVISYDCTFRPQTSYLISEVLAHDEPTVVSQDSKEKLMHMNYQVTGNMSWFTPDNPPVVEITLPDDFKTEECINLIEEIKPYLDEAERVIIVPRVNMDARIAATAWTRILKLNDIDEAKIKEFIKQYHNKGPEQTIE